jgi:hypothetical protein
VAERDSTRSSEFLSADVLCCAVLCCAVLLATTLCPLPLAAQARTVWRSTVLRYTCTQVPYGCVPRWDGTCMHLPRYLGICLLPGQMHTD